MMELALVKTLLSREFYDDHKGVRCPERIFSKDVRKIKQALDTAMEIRQAFIIRASIEKLGSVRLILRAKKPLSI